MRSLIEEIRQQPEHIRHIFMWSMVVITFSLVGFAWFRSTTKQFVALLHPEDAQMRALAANDPVLQRAQGKQASPFATLFNSWQDLRVNISELLAGPKTGFDINNNTVAPVKELPPQKLPLSN